MEDRPQIFFTIKNYKNLKEITLELKPLTYLFGPNGAGKSSVLSAISLFSKYLFSMRDEIVFNRTTNNELYYEPYLKTKFLSFNNIVNSENPKQPIELQLKILNYKKENKGLSEFLFSKLEQLPALLHLTEDEFNKEIKSNSKTGTSNGTSFTINYEIYADEKDNKVSSNVRIDILDKKFSYMFVPNYGPAFGSIYDQTILHFWDNKPKSKFINLFFSSLQFIPFISPFEKTDIKEILSTHILPVLKDHSNNPYWSKLNQEEKIDCLVEVIEIIEDLFIVYPEIIARYFKDPVHLPALREKPQAVYILSNGTFDPQDYYGIVKEFDLTDPDRWGPDFWWEDTTVNKVLNYGREIFQDKNDGINEINFLRNFFLYYLDGLFNLITDITVDRDKYSGSLFVTDYKTGCKYNLTQASSGILQLLPIIFKSYFDRESLGWTNHRLIEQPELHLHPKLQAKLAEFFADEIFHDHNFIIETHSEHLIRKTQVLIAQGKLDRSRIAVYYFGKDEKSETYCKEMEFAKNGLFKEPWPDDFFDDSYNLAMELINVRRN